MLRKRLTLAFGLLLIAGLWLSACQPSVAEVPVTVVIKETVPPVVQTQVIQQTQVVEVPKGAFTIPHPILSDVRIRHALAYCTHKLELVKSVYPLLTEDEQKNLVMDSFLPGSTGLTPGTTTSPFIPMIPSRVRPCWTKRGGLWRRAPPIAPTRAATNSR